MSKETERAALHKAIWQVANDLRGSVDGWDFKAYVLGFLFYRFISENLTEYINRAEHAAGDADFDYRFLSREDAEFAKAGIVEEKGFFILPEDLFANVRERAPRDENRLFTIRGVGVV
ncbi:type I restriction-modification system subunit M N-terminal domain-containing protein [Propionibacterium freudenreichii]|uniref:type I restriction-modification system subunit M N-terminal domain-containing protein n=1 Tax=Propionibacterium freudenreichii TaxID=1744 RepID=UPI000BC2DB40|nr:type I restriction-modification system subunit M N-terminal domain-containing protein [Propionibacterium freudenreichii]SBN41616.1 HsdM N-terminal domain protein [Propionibacterium freudenreichii]SCQ57482.1 HsdM N-terminal domain protein [Propionibacterium freudenreichii]SCQ60978.1 HsdM N-terminal domain protein [Propionibacterium freudenreichii]SCQ65208.1 HsdM N-terminal domain protein [Propionibacterium freudenreichii]SCQ75592.1 HsdM N-terminal domain protein [Propionibacterium freudenrei